MVGNGETRMVFACPDCTARFQAVVMRSPKAYRCPHCKAPFTIYPDGDIQTGDRTKPRQTIEPVRPPSEVFSEVEGNRAVSSPERHEEDETTLYKEVLAQFKELSSRQSSMKEVEELTLEVKKLRRENERLRGEVFSLEEKLSSIKHADAGTHIPDGNTELERLKAENEAMRVELEKSRKAVNEHEEAELELGVRIEQLENKLRDVLAELGSRSDAASAGQGNGLRQTLAEKLDEESKRLELWKRELDAYKSNLEDIALSLVKEKEEAERREVALAARERSLSGLTEREGRVLELERALLEREAQLREHLRGHPGAATPEEGASPSEGRELLEQREAAVRRVEDLLDARKAELDGREAELSRRAEELKARETSLRDLERSLAERQESLERARDKLRELKERMHRELGTRKGTEEARSKQRELKEKLESKQVGIQEMESKIKDLLK